MKKLLKDPMIVAKKTLLLITSVVLALVITMFLLSDANASCEKPVSRLIENQPSPCTGYLFTEEAERLNRLKLIEHDFQVKEIEHLSLMVDNQKQQLESYAKSSQLYEQRIQSLNNQKMMNDLEKILYFFAGILTTVLIERSLSH